MKDTGAQLVWGRQRRVSAQQATVPSRTLSHTAATLHPSPSMLTVMPEGTLIVGDLLKA